MKKAQRQSLDLEVRIELLKERIYATFALLAVLLTLDGQTITASHLAITIAATAVSLWAASLIASRMAYRIVMQKKNTDRARTRQHLLQQRPLLYAALFPLLVTAMAAAGLVTVVEAVAISIGSLVFLIIVWSALSARALQAGWFATLVLTGVELSISLAIISLKLASGH